MEDDATPNDSSRATGFGCTNADTYCYSCTDSMCPFGYKDTGRAMADHCKSSKECRPPGKSNFAQEGRKFNLQMIANDDRCRRYGKSGCDWFERTDPTGTYKCSGCSGLFESEAKASKHHKRTRCSKSSPPSPVFCHETLSGILVEVLPLSRRRLNPLLDAAAHPPPAAAASIVGHTGMSFHLCLCMRIFFFFSTNLSHIYISLIPSGRCIYRHCFHQYYCCCPCLYASPNSNSTNSTYASGKSICSVDRHYHCYSIDPPVGPVFFLGGIHHARSKYSSASSSCWYHYSSASSSYRRRSTIHGPIHCDDARPPTNSTEWQSSPSSSSTNGGG